MNLSKDTPSPYEYSPKFNSVLKVSPSYIIGGKLNSSMILKTGTNGIVGPGSYDISSSVLKGSNPPKWGIGTAKRDIVYKNNSNNDGAYLYKFMIFL